MSQDVTTTTSSGAPSPQTRAFADMLAAYANGIETTPGGQCLISDPPKDRDLELIEARRAELIAAKQPTAASTIVPRISRLFLRFPSAKIENPAATASAYASDLAEFPLWAIENGILGLIRRGGLKNKDFAPSSPVVIEAVQREIHRVDAELAKINRVLDAKEKPALAPDAERKARQIREAIDLIGGMKAGNERRRGMSSSEVEGARIVSEMIRTNALDPRPVPGFSPSLRASLGLVDEDHDMVPDLPPDHDGMQA